MSSLVAIVKTILLLVSGFLVLTIVARLLIHLMRGGGVE